MRECGGKRTDGGATLKPAQVAPRILRDINPTTGEGRPTNAGPRPRRKCETLSREAIAPVQRDASRRVEEQTIFMLDARPADKQDNAASAISREAMPKETKLARFMTLSDF